ncbi:MAG: UDP-N-acetylmuramoyl-L-alanyl-D-glutamate--2,6-diaminopimelate ligase [Lachnospiraceae bacterium]|nr:UDP-N-acetylmuramoyl-L-alanyl-D-glutamate--2,6-diaminopimelate ligase [Lachnospiraceae bacterium]
MKLRDIISCDFDTEIDNITDDSRQAREKTLFVCIKGLTVDGHKYASKAVEKGAAAIICEHRIEGIDVPQVVVENADRAFNEALNKLYGEPLKKLNLLGVTGTDGKTTTADMMYQILNGLGHKSGYIGTNGIFSEGYSQDNEYTTPLPADLFEALDGFVKDGCGFVSMEASGERLGPGKMEGVSFDASIFTNLTRDALDIFKTMDNYCAAKARLMAYTKPDGICVINKDDQYAEAFIKAAAAPVVTYGIKDNTADVYATDIDVKYRDLSFVLNGKLGRHEIRCNLSGIFNVYNLMAVIVTLNHFGIPVETLVEAISKLKPVEARQTVIDCGQPFRVIVDYAHTANAVKNLMDYIKSTLTDGYLRVVVGAGGSRDLHRRTDMAEYCTSTADYNYFTIEDARFEDPQMLVDTMVSTVPEATNYELIVDRDEAITKAIHDCKPGDAVLILGKGAEAYMMTNGVQVPRLNDLDRATLVLKEMGYNK